MAIFIGAIMEKTLKNKVLFITGASRGIGREIALRAARDGASIIVAAKTATPHPVLAGTIYSVAKEIEAAGGKALPALLDVRDEAQLEATVKESIAQFGNIDILVNNASAINLGNTTDIEMKRFDLIFSVNVRATFMCAKYCIPYLKNAANPHILN
jgi:citronellol/citronellal dehydrogenase